MEGRNNSEWMFLLVTIMPLLMMALCLLSVLP